MTTTIAKSTNLTAELPDGPTNEIQWMPPGTHVITATQGGETVTTTVRVTAATAARLQQQLQTLRLKALKNEEDIPYLDFNHDDREASARVLRFRWGGEDPIFGGIRALVEWTGAGLRALHDKAYRRFSPSFHLDTSGEVTGAPLNMGGLVNKAAFKNITPIIAGAAKGADAEAPQHEYLRMVQQLVTNLEMNETDAALKGQSMYPKVFLDYVKRSFAEEDRKIEDALKGLAAETRAANAAAGFVGVFQARQAAGASRAEAVDHAIAVTPDGYTAWRAAGCQPGL